MKAAHRNFADVTAATGDLAHFMHRWCEAEQDKVCAIAARDPRLVGRHIAAEDMAELERRLALMLAWRHLRDIGYRAHVIAEAIAFFYGVGRAALRRMWAKPSPIAASVQPFRPRRPRMFAVEAPAFSRGRHSYLLPIAVCLADPLRSRLT